MEAPYWFLKRLFMYIQRVSFEYIKGSPLMLVLIKIRNFMPIKNQDIYFTKTTLKLPKNVSLKTNQIMVLHVRLCSFQKKPYHL